MKNFSKLMLGLFLLATISLFAADQPNVLFIISDDLSAEALGSYGNKQCKTPHIDALAARGVQFTRAYCQYPVCGPSRAALMSGMYAQKIGVLGNGQSDRFTDNLANRPSMSQHFRQNGYHAARVSKIYHMRIPGDITAGVAGPDHTASWDEAINIKAPEWMSEGEHEHLTNERLQKDPDRHYGLGFGGAFYVVKGSTDGSEQPDHIAAERAIKIMEEHKDGPFFLAVGFVRPHVPLVAPAAHYEPYPPAQMQLPSQVQGDWDDIPQSGISKNSQRSGLQTQAKKKRVLSAYYASVTYMDEQVGKLLGAVDRLGLRDNTIVVFTSDHGYHLGEHEFWQKMSLHEESVRVPLIFSGPGISAAQTISFAQQIDIYPTLAALAGLEIPKHIQGKSLAGVLKNPSMQVHESVYCLRGRGDHLLRTNRWAYMRYNNGGEELYDMQNDPKQFTNLVQSKAYETQLAEMRIALDAKLESIQ